MSYMLDERHIMAAPDGIRYGLELAAVPEKYDYLDYLIDRHLTRVVESWPSDKAVCPQVLDIGGATGHRAEQMAKKGVDVLVIDLCDREKDVLGRNRVLGRNALRFRHADIFKLKATELAADWTVINLRRFIHWHPWDITEKLMSFLPQISNPDTHIAISYMPIEYNKNVTDGQHFYPPKKNDVLYLLRECKYELLDEIDIVSEDSEHVIFAKVPGKLIHQRPAQTSRFPG